MQALIIELDPLLLGGFSLAAEVLDDRLEKYGIAGNDPYRFLRNIYGKPFTGALETLLPGTIDVAHVERRLAATYIALLQQNAQQAMGVLQTVLRPIARKNVRFAVVTRLNQDIVSELFESVTSLDTYAVLDSVPLANGLTSGTIQAAITTLGYSVRQCYGLFACAVSVRAALRIGLRAIAVPDPMVSFESCAGADFVVNHFNEELTEKLLMRIKPSH